MADLVTRVVGVAVTAPAVAVPCVTVAAAAWVEVVAAAAHEVVAGAHIRYTAAYKCERVDHNFNLTLN